VEKKPTSPTKANKEVNSPIVQQFQELPASPPSPPPEEESSSQNLYKTELCRSFEETGACRYGLKCQFAHGRGELRPVVRHPKYKTEVCKTFHTIGTCPYGKRCRFIHTEHPLIQPAVTSPIQPKVEPTEKPNVFTQNVSDWSDSWTTPISLPVNFYPPEKKVAAPIPPKPTVIETIPVMKTSSEVSERRSRLVIFQQICS